MSSGIPVDAYRRCLQLIYERSPLIKDKCTNIVLTGDSLASGLAKLMLFDLARFVPAENVYSVAKISKEEAVKRIGNRFRKKHTVIISSIPKTAELAKQVCVKL